MMKSSRIRHHQGQALVLALSLISILILALIGMHSNARLMSSKLKQTHSADVAAYSGALIQARALNMQAYINVAQIAHQMAMAHLVTLGSWAKWASTSARSLATLNPPAWVITTHFGAKHGQAYLKAAPASVLSTVANQGGALYQQFAKHDEIVEQVLARVSYAIRDTMQASRDKAIQKVLESNYPYRQIVQTGISTLDSVKTASNDKTNVDFEWTLIQPSYQQFSGVFKPTANYRSLISDVAKIYRFLDERNHTQKSTLPVSSRCPTKRHELRRRGGTFLNDQGNWQSMDTQSYHALRSNKWIGCYYREYPMGWGWVPGQSNSVPEGVDYAEQAPDDFGSEDFWRWVNRATQWNIISGDSNPLANSRAISERHRWQGGGLVPYVDIRNAKTQGSLQFTLKLHQLSVQQQSVTVATAAETFFERPTLRRDGRKESANLWHPYWQARLIAVPKDK